VMVAPPLIVLPAHGVGPSSSPTTTGPVEFVIETWPLRLEPQIRMRVAPDAVNAPEIVAS
jgi:hypothetical protein